MVYDDNKEERGLVKKEKLSILVLGNVTETFEANVASEVNEELNNMMQRISSEMIRYNPGNYIMTDDKAPVELLGMKVIDELIREEVAYYKQVYKEGGIKALLEEL